MILFLYFLIRSFEVYTYINNNELVFLLLNVLLKILLIIWNIVYEIKIIIKQVLNKRAILQKYTWSKNFVIFYGVRKTLHSFSVMKLCGCGAWVKTLQTRYTQYIQVVQLSISGAVWRKLLSEETSEMKAFDFPLCSISNILQRQENESNCTKWRLNAN